MYVAIPSTHSYEGVMEGGYISIMLDVCFFPFWSDPIKTYIYIYIYIYIYVNDKRLHV